MSETTGNIMDEQQSVDEATNEVAEPSQTGDTPVTASEPRPAARPLHNGPNLTPRAIAKAEIFVEGDHVVYPTHGVGKVERLSLIHISEPTRH